MPRSTSMLYMTFIVLVSLATSIQAAQWHPVEKYCATYKIKGAAKGTMRTCQRAFGRERVEYTDTKIGFGPFKTKEKKRVLYKDEFIYSYVEGDRKIVKTENPLYKTFEQATENQSAEEISQTYLDAMGFGEIDGADSAGGVACNKRKSSTLGGFICMTDDLIPVITSILGQKQILTKLEQGVDGGSDHFDPTSYDLPIEEGPDVSKLLDQFSNMGKRSRESINNQEN